MPLTGICHDFAFSRSHPRASWETTPAVLEDGPLWVKINAGHMVRVPPSEISSLKNGVLTVANPAKDQGSVGYCTHSYYVDAKSGFLISTNDPFMDKVGATNVVPVAVTDTVTAVSYTFADLKNAMTVGANTARIGTDPRAFSFYWVSEIDVQTGSWWH